MNHKHIKDVWCAVFAGNHGRPGSVCWLGIIFQMLSAFYLYDKFDNLTEKQLQCFLQFSDTVGYSGVFHNSDTV